MDDQDALRQELRQFISTPICHPHPSGYLVFTDGVAFLAERARLAWLIHLIVFWQPHALKDRWLREFQLWELRVADGKGTLTCLYACDDIAFRQRLPQADSALDYVRLYVQDGVLRLPSEH
jgi:Family of unknown function (DUF6876)